MHRFGGKRPKPNVLPSAGRSADRASAGIDFIAFFTAVTGKPRLEFLQLAFLWVVEEAGDAGVTMGVVAERLGVDSSFVSRNAKAFGPHGMAQPMVAQRVDPERPKYRILTLTDWGRDVLGTAMYLLEGKASYDARTGTVEVVRA